MDIEKIIKNSIVNFNGKIAMYYDDLKGNTIKINENEKYNSASCIKIFILIELFNQISKGIINRKEEYHEMVGDGIDKIYKEVEDPIVNYIVSKSGKYESVRNDGGIVSTIYGNYILTII